MEVGIIGLQIGVPWQLLLIYSDGTLSHKIERKPSNMKPAEWVVVRGEGEEGTLRADRHAVAAAAVISCCPAERASIMAAPRLSHDPLLSASKTTATRLPSVLPV